MLRWLLLVWVGSCLLIGCSSTEETQTGAGNAGSAGSGGGTVKNALCPGAKTPSGQECRSSQDCKQGACMLNPSGGGCGAGPPIQCSGEGSCPGQMICETIRGSCGVGYQCRPACTATSCGADKICGAKGHCLPRSCMDGYVCPDGTICSPDLYEDEHGCSPMPCSQGYACPPDNDCQPGAGDPHGCVRRSCTQDGDCSCGACVNDRCAPHPGVCFLPPQ